MRPLRPIALGLLAIALAGCATTTPGWTYAPAPSITTAPSTSAGASAEPSDGGGTEADISAEALAFDTATLAAPVGEAFQLVFANNDPAIPHNVEIKDSAGVQVFLGDVFPGIETRTYDVPALAAGEYEFLCTVHPTMKGVLIAG
jgi:plastocyanin